MINLLRELHKKSILFLTGAGLSVDSGIPTFRGSEGQKSKAHRSYFEHDPEGYWDWIRTRLIPNTGPNKGHRLIDGTGCRVVTQNVDGLHVGYHLTEVHGSIKWMKCSRGCKEQTKVSIIECHHSGPIPTCSNCDANMIPCILHFDENYDPKLYEDTMQEAYNSSCLICVGTTITTGLPTAIWSHFIECGKPVIFINPENIFVGRHSTYFIQETAIEALPALCEAINHEN